MPIEPVTIVRSRAVIFDCANVDTDQIIPARFLSTTTRDGLGPHAFHDWRFDADGQPLERSPFAGVHFSTQQILVAGANFGCGSSREHAVWALMELGVRAVISPALADIFRSNCLKNGLLAIELSDAACRIIKQATGQIGVDLDAQRVALDGGESFPFEIDPFAKRCLLGGTDPLGLLLEASDAIAEYEARPC